MSNEEKNLLLADLCARLLYDVQGITSEGVVTPLLYRGEADWDILTSLNYRIVKHGWRPYLRPMSSMTEDEIVEYIKLQLRDEFADVRRPKHCCKNSVDGIVDKQHVRYWYDELNNVDVLDWLNEHHFDYRGLIEKGLALEAPKDMYKVN